MEWPELRLSCEQRVDNLLRQVGLPRPWSINEFIDRLERYRGREIDLCAIDWGMGDSSGAWLSHSGHDVIAYAKNTSSFHQDHIILHEVGHMVSQHLGRCVLSEEEAHRLAPDLKQAALLHLLDRDSTTTEEREAETIALLIHQHAQKIPHLHTSAIPFQVASQIIRVEHIFG